MAVFVLVLFDLLLRQRGKIILFKTGNKKCAADNVIRHTVIIGQGAVPRQAQQLALVIADERDRVIKRVKLPEWCRLRVSAWQKGCGRSPAPQAFPWGAPQGLSFFLC